MTRLLLLSFVAIVAFVVYVSLFLPPDWAIASAFVLLLLVLWVAGERWG
jgi:hypothetical protein